MTYHRNTSQYATINVSIVDPSGDTLRSEEHQAV